MRLLLLFVIFVISSTPVYGAVAISGSGAVGDESYFMAAFMDDSGTHLRLLLPDDEVYEFIFTDGNIYNGEMSQQNLGTDFAKLVIAGVLDPFFVLEIVSGQRDGLYRPYMQPGADGTLLFVLSPSDFLDLYGHWSREEHIAENILRQIVVGLDASVEYRLHCTPSGAVTQIDVVSQSSAPDIRHSHATILVTYPKLLPSS